MSMFSRLFGKRTEQQFRNFDAGKSSRRMRGLPLGTSQVAINNLIISYGRTALARSRWLCDNNPYASSAKEAFVAALVGTGIKPSFNVLQDPDRREALALAWRDWTDEADADWLTDFYGLQAMAAQELFEAGECFVRLRRRRPGDGLSVPLQLQLLPSEMLPVENTVTGAMKPAPGNVIRLGVEFDSIGRRVAYHFLRSHPHDPALGGQSSTEFTRVPADEIVHLFRPMKAGQIRGVPHSLSSIIRLAVLDAYDDAELERKRVAALFSVFVKRPAVDDDNHPLEAGFTDTSSGDTPAALENAIALEPGAVIDLDFGEDISTAAPADSGSSFEPFQHRALTAISAGFGVPYSIMTGDFSKANYSSERASLLAFRRRIEAMQHHVMVYQLCRHVAQAWMEAGVLSGALPISAAEFEAAQRDYSRIKWFPPRWDWVDPVKDINAEKAAVDAGFKARSDVIESMGEDPEDTDRRIAADQERAERLGLSFGKPAAPAAPAPMPAAAPGDDEADTEGDGPPNDEEEAAADEE